MKQGPGFPIFPTAIDTLRHWAPLLRGVVDRLEAAGMFRTKSTGELDPSEMALKVSDFAPKPFDPAPFGSDSNLAPSNIRIRRATFVKVSSMVLYNITVTFDLSGGGSAPMAIFFTPPVTAVLPDRSLMVNPLYPLSVGGGHCIPQGSTPEACFVNAPEPNKFGVRRYGNSTWNKTNDRLFTVAGFYVGE